MKSAIQNSFLLIIATALYASATVFTCIVTDSATGQPVDSVKAVLTYNFMEVQQPVYTDSSGTFTTMAPFDGVTNVQLALSKQGYCDKNMDFGHSMRVTGTYTQNVRMVKLLETTVLFRGVVIDSVTSKPLGGVDIQIAKTFNGTPFLHLTTDSSGKFQQNIVLSNQNSYFAFCKMTLPRYATYYYSVYKTMDSSFKTIRLRPVPEIQIKISGKVKDSLTHTPLDSSNVELWVNWASSKSYSSLQTGEDGTFTISCKAPSDTAKILLLSYTITARGYAAKSDSMALLPSKDTDLGDILLVKNGSGVVMLGSRKTAISKAEPGAVFSLNGKLLYRIREQGGAHTGRHYCGSAIIVTKNGSAIPQVKLKL
jgi:hypothetical protein